MQTYLSITQTAAKLDLSRARVSVLCNEGRFEGAKKIGSQWAIPLPLKILPPVPLSKAAKLRESRYRKQPHVKAKINANAQRPEIKAKVKAYRNRPEVREQRKLTLRKYRARPEIKKRIYARRKEYQAQPEVQIERENDEN